MLSTVSHPFLKVMLYIFFSIGVFFAVQTIVEYKFLSTHAQLVSNYYGSGIVAFTGNTCQETFFCRYPSGSGYAYDFCEPWQAINATCTGSTLATGTCVWLCKSTVSTTLTSCTIQPYATGTCAANDPCIGFVNDPSMIIWFTWDQCTGNWCGFLSGQMLTSLSSTSSWLCATGLSYIPSSFQSTSSWWNWECGSPFPWSFIETWWVACGASYTWSTIRRGWWKPSSITSSTCGDGKVGEYETCDDGNTRAGDGCSAYCVREWTAWGWSSSSSLDTEITKKLRDAIQKFESSCVHTDGDYRKIMFSDLQRNPEEEAIKMLQAYCIVKWYRYTLNKKYHTNAATSIGEAIKILVKIDAIGKWISFDEFGRYTWKLPYADMLPNARYTPYVTYAHDHQLLEWISSRKLVGRGNLKALTPITKKQLKMLLINFWADIDLLDSDVFQWTYVMRDEIAGIVTTLFAERFVDYKQLYGNNLLFYRRLSKSLENKTPGQQSAYIKTIISWLKKRDEEMIGWKYNFDVEGIIEFLETIVHK